MTNWREPPPVPVELFHYMQITIDKELLRLAGEQMPKTDPLDQPITIRQLLTVDERVAASPKNLLTIRRLLTELAKDARRAVKTDFVHVRFGSTTRLYTYKVASQPARRVQVGDLVTVPPNSYSTQPRIVRVVEVDVEAPQFGSMVAAAFASCVAISPEDAERIEAGIGRVR